MKRRVNLTISDEAYEALIKVIQETGLVLSEIVRNAIRMYKWAPIEFLPSVVFWLKVAESTQKPPRNNKFTSS